MHVDGFNQIIIKGVLYNRQNNAGNPDGSWSGDAGDAIMETFKKAGYGTHKVSREEGDEPHDLREPKEETKDEKKIREAKLKRWKDDRKGRYDLYISQGNPVKKFQKVKPPITE